MIDPLDLLRAVAAVVVLIFVCWLLSVNRSAIKWRPVFVGLSLQVGIAGVVLWWGPGQVALRAISDTVTQVVASSMAGAEFVFGTGYEEHFIAFSIPATIIFFSMLMSLLYYLGIIQWAVRGMAWLVRRLLPVSGAESLAACANVFIGNTESPLLIKPYIASMTQSELMAMMTGGMATVSGGVIPAYVIFGADAGHLLAASLMSAPRAWGPPRARRGIGRSWPAARCR